MPLELAAFDDVQVLPLRDQSDVAEVHAVQTDERTRTHAPQQRPDDVTHTIAMVERSDRSWAEHGLGLWVVRQHGCIVGVAGVTMTDLGVWNLYYRFVPEAGGRGLASALARAALDAAHSAVADGPVVARILADNVRSVRVAESTGLTEQWRGNIGLESDRLILADRPLREDLLESLAALG